MFQFVRDMYRRHRNKLLITTGVAAVSYLLSIYVRNKINEFQEQLKEENATRDLIKKRFSQTQKDCYMTFLSFLPVLVDPIFKELDVEEVTKELKLFRKNKSLLVSDGKSELNSDDLSTRNDNKQTQDEEGNSIFKPNKSKVELWQELKIKSLTRFLTLIYSESLLIILLHLQLNIISRKSYLKTALKLASQNQGIRLIDLEMENEMVDKDLPEQAFLSFTWWLLNKGWIKVKDIVNESAENIFNEINLREELNIEEFGNLIFEVQKSIDNKLFQEQFEYELYDNVIKDDANQDITIPTIVALVLPDSNNEFNLLQETNTIEFLSSFNSNVSNTETLQKMNQELKGYLEGDQIRNIIKKLVTIGISTILENVGHSLFMKQENKKEANSDPSNGDINNMNRWKLAFILAVLSPQTHELANRRIDNRVLYSMNNVEELDDLSASVYSNFDI